MKKLKVLFFLILILPSIGYTQEKQSTMATIVNLIKARKNEFADIKGALFTANKENNTEYYQGKQSFGAKTEALIYEKDKNRSRFLSYFDYNDTAELLKATAIIDDVIKTINIIAGNGPNSV